MHSRLAAILRNPIAAIGAALTTAAGLLFVFLNVLQLLGFLQNPYLGILVFVAVPALFVVGLLLIPVGLSAERRRGTALAWPRLDLNDPHIRRTVLFVIGATLVNLFILSMASYGAVEYTESQAFCGQVCHEAMEPEFVAHQAGVHGRVACVACHVEPTARGFLDAKLAGTRQLWLVLTGEFQRPISTPVHALASVQSSCENCHQPDRFVGDVVKTFYEYASDATNTASPTTLRLHVGGSVGGTAFGSGIHWHMNQANTIEYLASDERRDDIVFIRATGPDGIANEYFAEGVTPAEVAGQELHRMDCLDCHNRPAHTFADSAEREVDAALGRNLISASLPFVRREAVDALHGEYDSRETAVEAIARAMREGVPADAEGFDATALEQAIAVTQGIYARNVFPAMGVTWGTYASRLGHTSSNGCFRCHAGAQTTPDGTAISSDCEGCHGFE